MNERLSNGEERTSSSKMADSMVTYMTTSPKKSYGFFSLFLFKDISFNLCYPLTLLLQLRPRLIRSLYL